MKIRTARRVLLVLLTAAATSIAGTQQASAVTTTTVALESATATSDTETDTDTSQADMAAIAQQDQDATGQILFSTFDAASQIIVPSLDATGRMVAANLTTLVAGAPPQDAVTAVTEIASAPRPDHDVSVATPNGPLTATTTARVFTTPSSTSYMAALTTELTGEGLPDGSQKLLQSLGIFSTEADARAAALDPATQAGVDAQRLANFQQAPAQPAPAQPAPGQPAPGQPAPPNPACVALQQCLIDAETKYNNDILFWVQALIAGSAMCFATTIWVGACLIAVSIGYVAGIAVAVAVYHNNVRACRAKAAVANCPADCPPPPPLNGPPNAPVVAPRQAQVALAAQTCAVAIA